MNKVGTKYDVMNGYAKMTGGGLKKKDLLYTENGKIISKKMLKASQKRRKSNQKGGMFTRKSHISKARDENLSKLADQHRTTNKSLKSRDDDERSLSRIVIYCAKDLKRELPIVEHELRQLVTNIIAKYPIQGYLKKKF